MKKAKSSEFGKVLLILFLLWSFAGGLCWFVVVYWWFEVVSGSLQSFAGRLWSLSVLVTTSFEYVY